MNLRDISQLHDRAFAKAPLDLIQCLLYSLFSLSSGSRYNSTAPVGHGFLLFTQWHACFLQGVKMMARMQTDSLLPSRFIAPAFLLLMMLPIPLTEGNSLSPVR
jgi:hypothetical protein